LNNSISFRAIVIFTIIAFMLVIATLEMSLPINITTYGQQYQVNDTGGNDNSSSKVVILTFGNTHKTQFTTAKPILDQYGFKTRFFITCAYTNDQKNTRHLSWNDILALQEDEQDRVQRYTPVDLNKLSSKALEIFLNLL
jgi:hypothetical protein